LVARWVPNRVKHNMVRSISTTINHKMSSHNSRKWRIICSKELIIILQFLHGVLLILLLLRFLIIIMITCLLHIHFKIVKEPWFKEWKGRVNQILIRNKKLLIWWLEVNLTFRLISFCGFKREKKFLIMLLFALNRCQSAISLCFLTEKC